MSADRSGGSIIKKVLFGIALGASAVIIAWSISYFGLNKMLTVVYDLGAPNEKLRVLNNLYRKTTALNEQQRIDAIRNPNKPDRDFLEESNELLTILDSLTKMQWNDTVQLSRLGEMQDIIQRRNNLFLSYLRLRSNVSKDKTMARKFDTLTEMLSKENITADTSVRTSQKTSTTIRYVEDTASEGQKRSFLSKLFKRRPDTPPLPDRTVTEEVEVTVDTISIAKNNSNLAEATRLIDELGMNELNMRKKLADRELALLATSRDLFRQLVDIVHLVEAEELEQVRRNNEEALKVVDQSSSIIVVILLVFSLMAAALIYLIVIDVSRSNFFRKSLIREKERAEELSQVKERFLSNMSHEIRTPLQSIIGYAEQLRSNPASGTNNAVKAISSSSEHLLQIVNEVLDYSRLESGKIEFEKRGFYPLEVAEEVASALRVQARNKGLQLIFDTTLTSNEFVEGDQFRLRQVLYNLLGNAIKFTSTGFVKLVVSGATDRDKLRITFEVADSGIGIKSADVDRIFHRFEQATPDVSNTYGGTGLGLTIVKMIVEAQGGNIRVKSSEGQGSSFTCELSYKIIPQTEAIAEVQALKVADGVHALILDDDKLIVDLCALMLSNGDVPYELHENPEQLFQTGIDAKVSHILMDLRLGNVSGIELCRSLKKRIGKDVRIIAMTAMADSQALRDSLGEFDGVLRKPFRSEELYTVLGLRDRFSVVRKMTNNDEQLFQSVLADFVGETDRDIEAVEKAIVDERNDTMLLLVHRLSGRVGQFGFGNLSAALRQIESELETGVAVAMMKGRWDDLKERILLAVAEVRNSL